MDFASTSLFTALARVQNATILWGKTIGYDGLMGGFGILMRGHLKEKPENFVS
jgi:hypothetical protein